ncbi:hypothetical protein MASR1M42_03500 [Azonexus hydrophilus]
MFTPANPPVKPDAGGDDGGDGPRTQSIDVTAKPSVVALVFIFIAQGSMES